MNRPPLATVILTFPIWGGVAAVYNSNLHATLKSGFKCNFFEVLVLSFAHPDKKAVSFIPLYTGHQGHTVVFLLEFIWIYSQAWKEISKVVIVWDFHIHMDSEGDPLRSAFLSIIESIGFDQHIHQSISTFKDPFTAPKQLWSKYSMTDFSLLIVATSLYSCF